jgi:predicted nucleotidyltransferase
MTVECSLKHLDPTERKALVEFIHRLRERLDGSLRSVYLFGSRARGEGTPGSDLDLLIVVDSEDWRVHKQIRYLAADICLAYDLELSPRVWSARHLQEMDRLQGHLYRSIQRDGISLTELQDAWVPESASTRGRS